MQIEIEINGENKTFVASKVPMIARRKFLEIRAKEEELLESEGLISAKQQIEHENEMMNILVDVVFNNQFTFDQLLEGVTDDYFNEKLSEAIFGKLESEEGNETGK